MSTTDYSYSNDGTTVDATGETSYGVESSYAASDALEYGAYFGKWQDIVFSILFVVHLIGLAVVGIARSSDTIASRNEVSDGAAKYFDGDLLQIWLAVAVIAVGFALFWMVVMHVGAGVLIPMSMVGYIVLLVALAAVFALVGAIFYGIIFLIIAAVYAYFFWSWRSKIPFSRAMLVSAMNWIFSRKSTLVLATGSLLLLVVFVIIWIIIASAPLADGMESGSEFLLMAFLLFSLFWTTQVIKNVMHVAIAGAAAAWYFESNPEKGVRADSPLSAGLKRALTTSFGPVCLGSLIVAILQTIRALFRIVLNAADSRGFLACCINMILSYLESLVELFNKYAYTQVAIYGISYIKAAKRTWDLLKSHGVAGIINDVLTGLVFFFGALFGGLLCALVAGLWASGSSNVSGEFSWITAAIVGFLIGFIIVSHAMEVPNSYIAAAFVCIAEDPNPLPVVDLPLAEAFTESYGELIPAQAFRNAARSRGRDTQRRRGERGGSRRTSRSNA